MKKIKLNDSFEVDGRVLMFVKKNNVLTLISGTKGKEFIAPALKEVEDFFESKGYTRASGKVMWEHYEAADPKWTDKFGEEVKNWKQKANSWWFKNAEKIESKDTQKPVMVR
jgi:hypothetical protein